MNLYLIGPRGSGKSTVAPLVARLLGLPLFSSDSWTESQSGQSISEIFAQQGESRFRDWETDAIRVAAQGPSVVVDLGGGAVLRAENRQILAQGAVVWLFASAEVLWQRVSADPRTLNSRPRLTESEGLEEMRSILAERESLYAACADYEIDTSLLSPEEVARRIVARYPAVDKQGLGRAGNR